MQATNSMVHLYRAKFAVEEGEEPIKDQFYTTLVIPGNVIYTSETVKNRVDALKTPGAAAELFGTTWDGRYMDHTGKGGPKEKVHVPKEKRPNGAKAAS